MLIYLCPALGLQRIADILPTNDTALVIDTIARKIGALKQGGQPDVNRAVRYLIETFREGKYGEWVIDDLTFSGPTYFFLGDGKQTLASLPAPDDTPRALKPVDPTMPITSLAPPSVQSLTVPFDMPLSDRVQLAVSTHLTALAHAQNFPSLANTSKNQLRKQAKLDLMEKNTKRWQRSGVLGRSRFQAGQKGHMQTRSGKSILAFRRSNRLRKFKPRRSAKARRGK